MARLELLAGVRQKGESYRAIQACNDWLRMGAGRTLGALYRRYAKIHRNAPPTRSINTLKRWSARYGWETRATAYDALVEQRKNARRDAVMASGLALEYERVATLRRLAGLLEAELYQTLADGSMPALWLPDVKQVGSGENAERVDIVRFNRSLVEALRGVLDDLAKETGGRTQRHDILTNGESLNQVLQEAISRVYGGEDDDGEQDGSGE